MKYEIMKTRIDIKYKTGTGYTTDSVDIDDLMAAADFVDRLMIDKKTGVKS